MDIPIRRIGQSVGHDWVRWRPASEILCLYRRLLRAITYIPDSFARDYAHSQTVELFKRNAKRESTDKITKNRVSKARQWANRLERAGTGNLEDLEKVLLETHGRTGSRRRGLILTLLQQDESSLPKDDASLKILIEAPTTSAAALKYKPSPKLQAFIESQERNHPADSPKPKIKKLKIPKESMWGRPTPLKREIGLRKDWWATTLDRLFPPVPQHEWDRLRDLALGKVPSEETPKRRKRSQVVIEEEDVQRSLFEHLQPSLKGRLDDDTSAGAPLEGLEPNETGEEQRHISARQRRRLYAHVWSMTPTMTQDEVTKKWNVQWGSGKAPLLSEIITQPSASDIELFEGIENLTPPPPATVSPRRSRKEASSRRKAAPETI